MFYGLERALKTSRNGDQRGDWQEQPPAGTFWLHIASFSLYNVIIGYLLLHREETGFWSLLIYGVAMALHFVTNDSGLREDHKTRYDRIARWIIAAAVVGGWGIGIAVALPDVRPRRQLRGRAERPLISSILSGLAVLISMGRGRT